jgi:transcriptional regulator with XRE-family HTH domain
MTTAGRTLRDAREIRGLTLEDVERGTRIRAKFLAAIEADDLKAMPSPAQARGFMRNYALHLGVDPEPLLRMAFPPAGKSPLIAASARPVARPAPGPIKAAPVQDTSDKPDANTGQPDAPPVEPRPKQAPRGPAVRPNLAKPARTNLVTPEARRRFAWSRLWSADTLLSVTVTGALALLLVWGFTELGITQQLLATPTRDGVPLAEATAEITIATPTPRRSPTPESVLPTARPSSSSINITLLADQRVWLRILVDGQEVFAGLSGPAEQLDYTGLQAVEVWTANAAGTRIIWNGQEQPALGDFGDPFKVVYTLTGTFEPTPGPTATP